MREIDLQTAVNEIVASTLQRKERGDGFPFFLIAGAGISHPPIPLASGIERRCREQLMKDDVPSPPLDGKSALDRYQLLFDRAYPQAEDRQEFLHDLIHRKPISAANLRLAHLLGELKFTNLVFTTNFDEMLSRGLHLLGYDVVSCDHPKTTARIKPGRWDLAQVVHVHGTHWFYDCCNLRDEIESQARLDHTDSLSMGQLLDRVLADRSPLVVGYSGWEGDVIMSALLRRLRNQTLPRNLYWVCYRRPEAETLPAWLKDHPSVRLVLPPPAQEVEKTRKGQEGGKIGMAGEPLRDDQSNEPTLPARRVFEALIRKLNLKSPRLTEDPLDFFSTLLATSLHSEEDDGKDLYLIRQTLDRVRLGAKLEREWNENRTQQEKINAEALARVSDAVRRSIYSEAVEAARKIDLASLNTDQQKALETALENAYLGCSDAEASLGLAACEIRIEISREATKEESQPEWVLRSVKALHGKAYCLTNLGRIGEALSIYDEIVEYFGYTSDPALRERVARALFNKGVTLGKLGRSDEAVAVYEEVVARFADATEPALREQVAQALFNKGVALGQLGRSDEAVAVYEEVVARFADATEPALREQVAMALVNKGFRLGQLGRSGEAVAVFEDVVLQFEDSPEPALRESVAKALFNKGVTLGQLGRSDEAVAVYEEVVARFADATEPALREQVAQALVYKGVTLRQLGRSDEAVAVFEEVVARFADATEPALQEQVAQAFYNLSGRLGVLGRWSEALETARRAVSFGTKRYNLACALARTGNSDEALSELEGCLSRGEISREHVRKDQDWEALREDPRFQELTKEPEGA